MPIKTNKVRDVPIPVFPYPRGPAKLTPAELKAEIKSWGKAKKSGFIAEKITGVEEFDDVDIDHDIVLPDDGAADDDVEYVFDDGAAARFAAEKLKWLAGQLDLTQKEIAKRVGVSAVVINRIFKNPDRSSVATLRKIAKAMGVKLTELIHD